ncbi:MAG: Sodium Bile acid symporter family protein [Myxococcales bacterium]|nr:Sodium Bile acid symporter family protein [Myxococcales bacterium]
MLSQTNAVAAPMLPTINMFVRKHFVHIISLVALLAFLTPGASHAVRSHKLAYGQLDASGFSLFLMMLSAAIQCGFSAFRSVVARPKPLLVCLAQFFIVLPLSCWLLGQLCIPLLGRSLGEPIQIGLDLVILMPVAATATIWVRDTKGDIELLVSLVVITMSLGTLTAPAYLYFMSGLTANSIVIPPFLMLRQLAVGVLLPLVIGMTLNRLLRSRLSRVQPYFAFLGNVGLFMAVYLNVGTASPLLRDLSFQQIACAMLIVLAVNLANFFLGSAIGRVAGLKRDHQVTCEFSSGMRSNGTALVVGLASFPGTPLVTVPAAIYIIFQHLIASIVKSRLAARYGNGDGDGDGASARAPAADKLASAAQASPVRARVSRAA